MGWSWVMEMPPVPPPVTVMDSVVVLAPDRLSWTYTLALVPEMRLAEGVADSCVVPPYEVARETPLNTITELAVNPVPNTFIVCETPAVRIVGRTELIVKPPPPVAPVTLIWNDWEALFPTESVTPIVNANEPTTLGVP